MLRFGPRVGLGLGAGLDGSESYSDWMQQVYYDVIDHSYPTGGLPFVLVYTGT